MMIRSATPDDIRHVALRLRAADAEEQFACRFDDDPEKLAADLVMLAPHALASTAFCLENGQPATILTCWLIAPGLGRLHRISTGEWPAVARAVFRYGVTAFVPAVMGLHLRRAECAVLARHQEARAILRRLGFVEEGVAFRRGKHGEDFVNFGWVNPAWGA